MINLNFVRDPKRLITKVNEISKLADCEKNALGFWPPQQIQEAITRNRLIAAMNDERVVGFIIFSGIMLQSKIQAILTDSSFRRQAIGRRLLEYLISELESQNYLSIRADIAADLEASLRFYKSQGFHFFKEKTNPSGRRILIHVRELDSDTLFSYKPEITIGPISSRVGSIPLISIDLNVFLDAVKRSDEQLRHNALTIIKAALAHQFRLVVAKEFEEEFRRTSGQDRGDDPILKFAMALPKLPKVDQKDIDVLAKKIHSVVFSKVDVEENETPQSNSDAKHLAHVALSGARVFISRDSRLLNARDKLLSEFGIDVVDVQQLRESIPEDSFSEDRDEIASTFSIKTISSKDFESYLSKNVENSMDQAALYKNEVAKPKDIILLGVYQNNLLMGVAAYSCEKTMYAWSYVLIHIEWELKDASICADYILDKFIRKACEANPRSIRLLRTKNYSVIAQRAKMHGFVQENEGSYFFKVGVNTPITQKLWHSKITEISRHCNFTLSDKFPNSKSENINGQIDGQVFCLPSLSTLEEILYPSLIIWPERECVILSIKKNYARELLGTKEMEAQPDLTGLFTTKDASLLSNPCYVNSPRFSKRIKPGQIAFFYETKSGGGAGAIIAMARVDDVAIYKKQSIPSEKVRRLVVPKVKDFSSSEDVLITTFSSLLHLPQHVLFETLQSNGLGKSNFQAPERINSDDAAWIVEQGYRDA